MRRLPYALLLLYHLANAADPPAGAADDLDAYAIVVGSNAGGPGQAELRFAEDDARRVADLLSDLGGYDPARVKLVVHPTADQVLAALDNVARAADKGRAAGRRSLVFFYYSGHAKASALDLGADELPLTRLRERLTNLPATLTVVILDACQSGAFSRVKGAEPAADFSFNSRARLDAAGIAVMASSSASELSQESDTLRSSYFTNYLLAGLRGAGDANGDGRVSLDETYQYAYHQTLLATAVTAVGSQHVTLEVDLKGQGEVPLSFPQKARGHLVIPAEAAGDVYVERLPAQAVMAELSKARGGAVRLALAPGDYRVLIHHDRVVDSCPAHVSDGGAPAMLGPCETSPEVTTVTKGAGRPLGWQIEASIDGGFDIDDAYVQRLRDFGYSEDGGGSGQLSLVLLKGVVPHVSLGLGVHELIGPSWRRGTELMPLRFSYGATLVSAVGRTDLPLGAHTSLYGQVSLGVAHGHDELSDATGMSSTGSYWSWGIGATGAFVWMPWKHTGFAWRVSYLHAPAIDNRLGDTHDAGGLFLGFGLEVRP